MRIGMRNQNLKRETARKWRMTKGPVSVNPITKALFRVLLHVPYQFWKNVS